MSLNRKTLLIATAALVASTTFAAASGDYWRRKAIDAQQAQHSAEIEKGRYQGQLTRREYRRLLVEQAQIRDLQAAATRDGYVSKREFRDIRSAQVSAGQHIAEDSTNRRKSWLRRLFYLTRY
jgi:Skp family chaperone for outer membrane proteins